MDEGDIWCEPMIKNGDYIEDESAVIYVLDNCSSKVIPYCKGRTVYEVTLGEDDFEDEDFEINGNPVSKTEFEEYVSQFKKSDEKPTTTSKESHYFINGKSVDKYEFDKKCDELEEKYLDNIRDMLLNHLEFQQEMDEWRRLFRW